MILPVIAQAFLNEFSKIAAWEEKDKKLLKDLLKKQNEFDRAGHAQGTPGYDAHKANTARINHLMAKKRGEIKTVPGWVRKPGAKPPTSEFRRGGGAPSPGAPPPRSAPHGAPGGWAHGMRATPMQTLKAVAIPAAYTAALYGTYRYSKYRQKKVRAEAAAKRREARKAKQQAAAQQAAAPVAPVAPAVAA